MSGSYSSRLRGGGGGGGLGATTLLVAKVAFASAALAAAASLARVALPLIVSSADGFLWKLYLFVTVHVIIFVIWKLSDNKHFHAPQHKDPWAPVPHYPATPLLTEEMVLSAMKRKKESAMKRKVESAPAAVADRAAEFRVPPPVSRTQESAVAAQAEEFRVLPPVSRKHEAALAEEYRVPPPVSRPHLEAAASPVDDVVVSPGSCGGESCVTTESEEDATVAASSYIAATDSSRSVAASPTPVRMRPVVKRERAVVQRGISLPPPPVIAASDEHFDGANKDDNNGDDDLDATWNAIMQKTRPSTAPASSPSSAAAPRSSPPRPVPSPRPRAREPSVGAAELNKRSEDFIKKIHNSFGRHQ